MKETVLRILHSTKEPIHAMSRRQTECVFHCSIPISETLLQEEVNCGQVLSLRVRQLSNPPPEINLRDSYKTVTKLELSCPIEVSWVFGLGSILPSLTIVRFGSSCFDVVFGDCTALSQSWLTKSNSVKELIISFDHRKLIQEDYDKGRIFQTINSILEHSTLYFIDLVKADLYLPSGVKLEEFLRNNPLLASTGERREISKHNTVHFQSYTYTDKTKKPPALLRSESTGSDTIRLPMKRPRSDTTDFSSEPDEEWEEPQIPSNHISKSHNQHLRSPPIPSYNNNHINSPKVLPNHPPPPSIAVPDFTASDIRTRRNGEERHLHGRRSPEAIDPDFNQMFTRRRY